jgi:hypothetical protein
MERCLLSGLRRSHSTLCPDRRTWLDDARGRHLKVNWWGIEIRRRKLYPLPKTVSVPSALAPQFLPQPANVNIQRACAWLRRITKDLRQKNRSGHNFANILHLKCQQGDTPGDSRQWLGYPVSRICGRSTNRCSPIKAFREIR